MTTATMEQAGFDEGWIQRSTGPLLIGVIAVIVAAALLVFSSSSTWELIGTGRGLVTPDFYPVVGLLIVLGTTFGQFVGWACGSALLAYAWSLMVGGPVTLRILQFSTTIVYFGLATVPMFFYHVFFGQPLAGIPRPNLPEWLSNNYPDTYRLIFTIHPIADWAMTPLAIGVLILVWGFGERIVRERGLMTVFLLFVLATSFVVAVSLVSHSALAHLRVMP